MEDNVSKYKKLTVVGEEIEESEWEKVEKEIDEIEDAGMRVIKIINYKEGSTKYIAAMKGGFQMTDVRQELEAMRWKLLSPYYSHGEIVGFKVARDREAKDVSTWGGV
jgi:hypothetical protein